MFSINRRLKRVEDAMRRSGQRARMVVVFSSSGMMKFVGGGIDGIYPVGNGERMLSDLSHESTIVHFNIPRPGMVPFGEVET